MASKHLGNTRAPAQLLWAVGISLALGLGLARVLWRDNASPVAAPPATRAAATEAGSKGVAVRLAMEPEGNELRYWVREGLTRTRPLADVIGRTASVAGGISLDSAGQVIPGASLFVINVPTLRSYRLRPIPYVATQPPDTPAGHSPMVLRVSEVRGLPWPLPETGTATFQLAGHLSLNRVVRPTTWTVAARFDHRKATGKAATEFVLYTFHEFKSREPGIRVVRSVPNVVRLGYAFRLLLS